MGQFHGPIRGLSPSGSFSSGRCLSETDNRRRWRPAVAAWRRTPGESVTKQSRIRKQQTRQAAFDRVNSRAWVPMDDTHTMFVSAGRLRL
jgi:hypothetical protein